MTYNAIEFSINKKEPTITSRSQYWNDNETVADSCIRRIMHSSQCFLDKVYLDIPEFYFFFNFCMNRECDVWSVSVLAGADLQSAGTMPQPAGIPEQEVDGRQWYRGAAVPRGPVSGRR